MDHLPLLTGLLELVDVPDLRLFLEDLLIPLRCQEFVPLYVLIQLVVARSILVTLFSLLLLNLIFELFEVFKLLKLPMKEARHLSLLSEDIRASAKQICYRFLLLLLLPVPEASFLINRIHFDS